MCSLKQFVSRDVRDNRIWFDPGAFGKMIDINGRRILGVMTGARLNEDRQTPGTEGYARASMRLYVRTCDVSGVNAGSQLRIDGKIYVVKYCDDMAGAVMRIGLEAADP